MVYPEGTFLWWGLFIPGLKTIAYVVDKQSDIYRRFCYRDYVWQVSKLQHMYAIGLIPLSALETTKKPCYIKFKSKVLKQINPTNQINDFFGRSLF